MILSLVIRSSKSILLKTSKRSGDHPFFLVRCGQLASNWIARNKSFLFHHHYNNCPILSSTLDGFYIIIYLIWTPISASFSYWALWGTKQLSYNLLNSWKFRANDRKEANKIKEILQSLNYHTLHTHTTFQIKRAKFTKD